MSDSPLTNPAPLDYADNEGSAEQRLPKTWAAAAAPYLRKIFALINSPHTSRELSIPEHLQEFVTDYLAERGYKIRFIVGPTSKKHYVSILALSGE